MGFTALLSRTTRRGRRPSSPAERALADARADAALEQRKRIDPSRRDHSGWHQSPGGSFDGS